MHRDDQLARIEQWLAAIEDRQERHRRWQMSHVTAAWRCLVWGLLVALAFGVIGFVIGSIAGSSAFGGIVGAVVGFICTSILTSIDVNRSSNRT